MSYKILILIVVVLCGVGSTASAVDISVPPGDGTLAAAMASASDGDTLVLGEGVFSGDVTVDRSLTIRPVNRATDALVTGIMNIAGNGISVTIQHLKLTQTMNVDEAASVRLLENDWLSGSINVSNYMSSEGDGTLVIVGNRLPAGTITVVRSDNAYIAGNTLLGIQSETSGWIVGNEIGSPDKSEPVFTTGDVAVRIIANRVQCGPSWSGSCILAGSSFNLVSANAVEIYGGSGTKIGILANGNGHSVLVNNVIRGSGFLVTGSPIDVRSPSSRISGNIVLEYETTASPLIRVTSSITEVTHNLCFNNSGDCPIGDGNLNIDPQFVDLIDYQLEPTSPAIDAGPPDYGLADLDRTRNDMGVHGGPWSIGQYDVQRDPNSLAPFVYPLFKADSSIFDGNLEIQAIGVARLR